MYSDAMNLLRQQFKNCMSIVENDVFFRGYTQEKWRHSMQVMGAGNYLLRHIDWLKNKPAEYIEMIKTAILLHDVCRFVEIERSFKGQKGYDHSVGGGLLLQNMVQFDDIRIWLPIKHHGHKIGELYADEQYQNITDKSLQREVELICFLIRDADKIANLHMLAYEPQIRALFFGKAICETPQDRQISEILLQNAHKIDTLPRDHNATYADRTAGFVSWFLDINYHSAMEFCNQLKVIPKIFALFTECCDNQKFKEEYCHFVQNYINSHKYLR